MITSSINLLFVNIIESRSTWVVHCQIKSIQQNSLFGHRVHGGLKKKLSLLFHKSFCCAAAVVLFYRLVAITVSLHSGRTLDIKISNFWYFFTPLSYANNGQTKIAELKANKCRFFKGGRACLSRKSIIFWNIDFDLNIKWPG